ncbi:MAG TPA: ABC transporter ATP-binding protein [Acidimicrobiales bacterium]|nr:ABC transporter ATP-binding protein [Acidimicrobiales bacterium]
MLLEVESLHVHYGKVEALKGVSLAVAEGEIVSLIGANGAGKTTVLRTISGLRRVTSGRVRFQDEDITHVPGHRRVGAGLCQVPEGRGIFPGMSVMENLEMGAYGRPSRSRLSDDFERAFSLFPQLSDRRTQAGGTLSGGEQQMLAIARALMARPHLVMLDEPSMGLAPLMVKQIFDIIVEINKQGTTVLLVEQNAAQALARANRAYVLETGRVAKSSDAATLLADDSVRAAYLGVDPSG